MLFQRILVTGANGLLGQALVERLAREPGYDVLATGRQAEPLHTGVSGGYVSMDVTSPSDVRAVFDDFAPDVVVNCAAMTQVDACESERDRCWKVNVDAVDHLARACLAGGSRLVQVSTDFVFDGRSGPYRENDRPEPVNFYGRSKLAAENAARGAGMDRWSVVRTVLVFGTGERLSRSNFVLWVAGELAEGRPVRVVTDQFRTPTWSADLADGIERVIRFGKTGTYHISGRELMSVHEAARTVAEVFGHDPDLVLPVDGRTFSQPAPRPLHTGFLILKAETELGYRPTPFRRALATVRDTLACSESRP